MMRWLVETALRMRVAVVALAALFIVMGIRKADEIPMDVFPEFAPPLVEIQTEAPGLSTEEVDSLITVPIENALNGTSWLETIRSKSVLGLSSVVLIFEKGVDIMRARQLVQERLALVAPRLPEVVDSPVILSPLSALSRVLKIGISSGTLTMMDLTDLAKWKVRPRLMAVPGVANVAIWGQRDRQLQVLIDPQRLDSSGITLEQVIAATREAVSVGAGGFVDTPNQRLAVRLEADIRDTGDLARAVVAYREDTPIVLGDIASIVEGHPPLIGDGVINDGLGLLLIVEKQPWANTLEVTRNVERVLDTLRPGLAGVEIDSTIFRPATFIEMSLANLERALLLGCLFVAIVLVVFLYDWRTAFISLTAIPISLLAAAVTLYYRGGTIDTMVLAGLVIALGEVVDDAIIDVENISRRLRLNSESGSPRSAFRVVLEASLEVRSAVVFGSLIVILVVLPVFFLDGLAGSFFSPLALAYIVAIVASLLTALTVTPALCLLILPRTGVGRAGTPPLISWIRTRYCGLLQRTLRRPAWAGVVFAIGLAATAVTAPFLGEEFMPRFKEHDFLMHWVEKPGTSIEAMDRLSIRASRELRSIPGVRNFGAHVGRAEVADEVVGPNFTELWISVDPSVDYEATIDRIQEVVDGYPGLYRDVLTYLRERIKEVLTGASATIVVRIYGPDLDVLRNQANLVADGISDVPGVTNLNVEHLVAVPQIVVRLRPEVIERLGLNPGTVRRNITTLLRGLECGEIFDNQKIYDIVVWGTPSIRTDPSALRRLRIELPNGSTAPLEHLAAIEVMATPNIIKREGASRRIDVTCNVEGRDLGSVSREIEKRVRSIEYPREYHPEVLGEYEARSAARRQLMLLFAASVAGILLLLHIDLRSWRLSLIVFLALPFSLLGGVFSAMLGGGVLSLGSMIGFVAVFGIAARNAIMLVSHYRHLVLVEGIPFDRDLVVRGAEERVAPILMTALTTALALMPIVVGGNRPGHEIEHPLAIVIVGGLLTSTVLNLFLIPAFVSMLGPRTIQPAETID